MIGSSSASLVDSAVVKMLVALDGAAGVGKFFIGSLPGSARPRKSASRAFSLGFHPPLLAQKRGLDRGPVEKQPPCARQANKRKLPGSPEVVQGATTEGQPLL